MCAEAYSEYLYMEQPGKTRPPMDVKQRAKQFQPFSALCGFSDKIAAREITYDSCREPGEDRCEELSYLLAGLQSGEYVMLLYFQPAGSGEKGFYKTITGIVTKKNQDFLILDNQYFIAVGSIIHMEVIQAEE